MHFPPVVVASAFAASILSVHAETPASPSTTGTWPGSMLSRYSAGDVLPKSSLELVSQSYIPSLGLGKSVLGTDLRIAGKSYEHGIGTYAASEVIVRLPGPGKTFRAEIGIDNNLQTAGQRGSSIFVIEVSGKEAFRSQILRASSDPVAVEVDLHGATEFILRTLSAGDGPEYDEADWAQASVTLTDGKNLWLDEMPAYSIPARFAQSIPFSFTYGGRPSTDLLPKWTVTHTRTHGSDGRDLHTSVFRDPDTGMEVTIEVSYYDSYRAAEWVVYFRNTGTSDTPIIENIRALDLAVDAPQAGDITLHRSHGSTAGMDFLPFDEPLAPNTEISFAPVDGRSSDTNFPYFNLEWPGGGLVGAIGWSGQWSMNLERDAGGRVELRAGQQTTHMRLRPGETIRTPRILLVSWRGNDRMLGHNRLRRLTLDHYTPKHNGEVVVPPTTHNTWFTFNVGNEVNESNQIQAMEIMSKLGVECYWLDAGWFQGGWPDGAGSWDPRPDAFPNGLKPLGDAAHKKGMRFVLWFEPERVTPVSKIGTEHKEWIMHVAEKDRLTPIQDLGQNEAFDLGNPEARQWLTDYLSKRIGEWGVDIFRQDFNIFGILKFWQNADAPDRQGMAENQYIQGLYAMWDELLRRHPGLAIDNCASGGRRIDLEMNMRSFPLWQSDSQCCGMPMPVQDQVQTAGLSLYVPLHSAGVWSFDPYAWRSVATTGANLCMNHLAPDFDPKKGKRAVDEVKALRPLYLGDYYPLTEINQDERQWCAWQFDRPELGKGVATFFRRSKSIYASMDATLHGLDRSATYEVTFVDQKKTRQMTGQELSRLRVTIDSVPGSALITYRKK